MTDTPSTDPAARSDEALMRALQAGDDAALAPLMERWELGVKAFLLRLGVPPADVEDVAQEAFVRLYQKRASYRADAAFKPWLLTIAGNLGRNRLRWRFRRREDSMDAMTEKGADPSVSPADVTLAETEHRVQSVRAAVAMLPPALRQTVVCVELEDLSYNEAASVLGCTAKAVETRLYRARQLLRVTCAALLRRG
jgi:RNA polymerase sigma-70 factor (ECF subfamily)